VGAVPFGLGIDKPTVAHTVRSTVPLHYRLHYRPDPKFRRVSARLPVLLSFGGRVHDRRLEPLKILLGQPRPGSNPGPGINQPTILMG
jgi:hypothetical protein